MADGRAPGIYRKLMQVMNAVPRIPKNGTNTRFNYKFAMESDVADVLRDAMIASGVAFTASVDGPYDRTELATQGGGVLLLTRVPMRLQFIDVDDGSMVEIRVIGEGMDTQDKSIYKAMTGGIKYGLLKQFLIPTGDEPDADNVDEVGAHKRQPPRNGPATSHAATGAQASGSQQTQTPTNQAPRITTEQAQKLEALCELTGVPVAAVDGWCAKKAWGPNTTYIPADQFEKVMAAIRDTSRKQSDQKAPTVASAR